MKQYLVPGMIQFTASLRLLINNNSMISVTNTVVCFLHLCRGHLAVARGRVNDGFKIDIFSFAFYSTGTVLRVVPRFENSVRQKRRRNVETP